MPLPLSGRTPTHLRRAGLAAVALAALSACSSSGAAPSVDGAGAKAGSGYDKIITSAPVADSSDVDANAWAKKIKAQGYLKVGGTDSGPLFSIRTSTPAS